MFNEQKFVATARHKLDNYKFREDDQPMVDAVLAFQQYRKGKISAADTSKHIIDFLIAWGMARAGISHQHSEKWLSKNLKCLTQKVSNIGFSKRLETFDVNNKRNQENIKILFNILAMHLGKKKIQSTAASKVLFVMAPKLFPMWDDGMRTVRGCASNSEGYVVYMSKMKEMLTNPKLRRIRMPEKEYQLRAFEWILWCMYRTSKSR